MPANEAPTRRDETPADADVSVTVSGDASDLEVTTTPEAGSDDVLDLDDADLDDEAPELVLEPGDVDEPDVLDIDDEDVPVADMHAYEDDDDEDLDDDLNEDDEVETVEDFGDTEADALADDEQDDEDDDPQDAAEAAPAPTSRRALRALRSVPAPVDDDEDAERDETAASEDPGEGDDGPAEQAPERGGDQRDGVLHRRTEDETGDMQDDAPEAGAAAESGDEPDVRQAEIDGDSGDEQDDAFAAGASGEPVDEQDDVLGAEIEDETDDERDAVLQAGAGDETGDETGEPTRVAHAQEATGVEVADQSEPQDDAVDGEATAGEAAAGEAAAGEAGDAEAGDAEADDAEADDAEADDAEADDAEADDAEADDAEAGGEQAKEPGKPDLAQAVERLRTHVATLSLTLDLPDATEARRERELLLRQLDDYLLPRLRRRDAPLLAVIGGSTGAGKSTLTNSLVRREVTRSGVLRPTTRSPVLVHHPYDSGAFLSQRILPRLVRVTSEAPEPMQPIDPNAPRITGLRLVPHDGLTPGMAIIDAPDIDSLVETNRELAVQLLGAADLWIFVTTAARYADAMPWEMLKQAADRGVAVAVVLDRVPPEVLADLRVHLATRLRDRGLGGAPLFALPETQLVDGFLPVNVVKPLQQWLARVAGDARSREVIADRTLNGIVASLPARADLLAGAASAQSRAWTTLMEDVERVFVSARARLLSGLTDGSLIGGEVQNRWQEYVTDGGVVNRLDGSETHLGDRVSASVRQEDDERRPLDGPVTLAARATVQAAIRAAAEVVLVSWRTRPYGGALLEARGHQLSLTELSGQIELSLSNWRQALVDAATALAAQAGEQRLDPQAVSDVLFVVTMDERPETSGADPASVAPARQILAGIVGDEAVRSLVGAARADLVSRSAVLLDSVRLKLERMLEAGGVDERRSADLKSAAENVEKAR